MSNFGMDVKKFADKTTKRMGDVRAVTYEMVSGAIVDDTPVKTGYTAGNWLASSGSPREGVVSLRSRSDVKAEIARVADNARGKPDDPIFLRNNVGWIRALENGSSKQAPQGMLRKNIVKFQRVVKAALGKVRGG